MEMWPFEFIDRFTELDTSVQGFFINWLNENYPPIPIRYTTNRADPIYLNYYSDYVANRIFARLDTLLFFIEDVSKDRIYIVNYPNNLIGIGLQEKRLEILSPSIVQGFRDLAIKLVETNLKIKNKGDLS